MKAPFVLPVAVWMLQACCACPASAPADDATAEVVAAELGAAPNVHRFGSIYLAAQPSAADLAAAAELGVRTVYSVRHPEEHPELDEAAVVADLGMTFASDPWNGPDELDDDAFAFGREVLSTAERPLLFHCGSANRVGAIWAAWRALDGGVPLEEALREAREIGLRTPAYEEKAREYVERRR